MISNKNRKRGGTKMKNSKTITMVDIIALLLNDLLGWFIIIMYDLTGNDNKFQNMNIHHALIAVGLMHIILSMICNVFFFKTERTKHHIQIGSKLFIYNIVMTFCPYLYLAFTQIVS
jgi:Kef-type K+ transport system membrane component KefB